MGKRHWKLYTCLRQPRAHPSYHALQLQEQEPSVWAQSTCLFRLHRALGEPWIKMDANASDVNSARQAFAILFGRCQAWLCHERADGETVVWRDKMRNARCVAVLVSPSCAAWSWSLGRKRPRARYICFQRQSEDVLLVAQEHVFMLEVRFAGCARRNALGIASVLPAVNRTQMFATVLE
jgi:hypothetical protein